MKTRLDKIYQKLAEIFLLKRCPCCERKLPNNDMLTDNGCVWCDSDKALKNKEETK